MNKTIKFVAYSDIHHHEYSNGITGDDACNVEDQIIKIIQDRKCDFWIFGGDRFLSRNPLDISRKKSDSKLKIKNDLGIPGIIIVGNHDRSSKNPHSPHNYWSIEELYHNELKNISILDHICTYSININEINVNIYAMPAGHIIPEILNINTNGINICVFHDIIRGCRYHTGMVATEGMATDVLDKEEFSIVLGGDNHRHQKLNLKNVDGWYIGSPMQHNWGDINNDRGCMFVEMDDCGNILTHEFIKLSYPEFIKETISIKSVDEIFSIKNKIWKDNIIRLSIEGPREVLSGIDVSMFEEKLRTIHKARSIKINLIYLNDDITTIPTVHMQDDESMWDNFLTVYNLPEDVDKEKIKTLGMSIINHAKNT